MSATTPPQAGPAGPDDGPADDGPADVADRSPAWEVVRGGTPDTAVVAAITVALTPVAVAAPADGRVRGAMPNWRRAAIIEAIGGRPASSHQDLVQGRFGLGFVGDAGRRRAAGGG